MTEREYRMTEQQVLEQMKDNIEGIRKLSLELSEMRHIPVTDHDANVIQTVRAVLGMDINKLIQDYDEWFKNNCIGCRY